MVTALFHQSVFGPIHSRRFGTSLGINLLPNDGKICSYDCIYCEVGYNSQGQGKSGIPSRQQVKHALVAKLKDMNEKGEHLDVITFAGNGEPTLHPEFLGIITDTVNARNRLMPGVKINVLTNATFVAKSDVAKALQMVDGCMLKLDSAIQSTQSLINAPVNHNVIVEGLVANMKSFKGNRVMQTMFLRGEHNGRRVDNTTEEEVDALIKCYKEINPSFIEIYSLDRATPEENLQKVSREELEVIAERIRAAGFTVQAY